MADTLRLSHRRHKEDKWVDEATIAVGPRWKTSSMSGDEWRFSYKVVLKRKGYVLQEKSFGTMTYAAAWLAMTLQTACPAEQPWPEDAPGGAYGDGYFCDNPGCGEPARWRGELRAEYDPRGRNVIDAYAQAYHVFCGKHKERGDCSLQDCGSNYVWTALDT